MPAPDAAGRAAILAHHLSGLRPAAGLDQETLAGELAAATPGLTGADLAGLVRAAVACCVKAAVKTGDVDSTPLALHRDNFTAELKSLMPGELGPLVLTEILPRPAIRNRHAG